MFRAEKNNKEGKKNNTKKKIWKADMEVAALNKQRTVVRVPYRNSTICNVSGRIYYQYFTFKGLDYARNKVYSLFFLQIFFQSSIFRKLTITVISSSQ